MASAVKNFDPRPLLGKVFSQYDFTLSSKDVILYALSIGAQADPLKTSDFKFTYENDGDFQSFPTIACAYGVNSFGEFAKYPGFPPIDLDYLLHGEEQIEVFKPLKGGDGTVYLCKQSFKDFQDKGNNTVIVSDKTFTDKETGEVCVRLTNIVIAR
jgi:hypothetical protein